MASSGMTVACAQCGALNGDDFGSCIRCNQPLHKTEPADKAKRRVPAPRKRAKGVAVGRGSEALFGKYPAELLPAAKLLVFLNVAAFAGFLLATFPSNPSFEALFTGNDQLSLGEAMSHGALLLAIDRGQIVDVNPWRLLSACYMHFSVLHIGMNMMSLIYLARVAEPAIGSVRFFIAYTLTGIFGFVASLVWFLVFHAQGITAGASGAVFGVMGLILGIFWRRRDDRWKSWLIQVVVFSVVFALVWPGSINHTAHVGGLISGVGFGVLFAKGAPQPSRAWHRWVAALCVIASLVSLIVARLFI